MPPPKKKAPRAIPKSMEALRENLGKKYGNQVVTRSEVKPYEVLSTGSMALDLAHRTGGLVEGRIHEFVGPEGSGKTTQLICTMIEAQRKYPKKAVGYIDMEQTFDYTRAEELGLDTSDDRFVHIYPDDAEDVSDLLRRTAETGLFSLVSVDSIGGMESKEAFEKDAEAKVMGNNAQIITRMVKHCAVLARREKVTIILVNQLRANLNQGPDISAGPKAMKYSTTTKTIFTMLGGVDNTVTYRIPGDSEDAVIGAKMRARVARSKVAIHGKVAEYWLFNYDTTEHGPIGIDRADEAVTIGLFTGVIEQGGGGYYTIPSPGTPAEVTKAKKEVTPKDYLRIRGKESLLDHLRSCPDDMERVRIDSIAAMAGDVIEEVTIEAEMVGAEA